MPSSSSSPSSSKRRAQREAAQRKPRSLLALAGFGLATAGAAWYGSRYSPAKKSSREWYRDLDKPGFTPPDAAFPIVWTSLYAMMAWSGWRVWSAPRSMNRSLALRLWFSQLSANAKWSKLFFGKHRPDLALRDLLMLEAFILGYIAAARDVDRAASQALIPYAAWVAFAGLLNAEIVRRNPEMIEAAAG
jgi:benzodiazapine receptor